jgi:hypothetical protein
MASSESPAASVSRAETIRRALRVNISAAEHEEVLAALDSLLAEREQFRTAAEGLLDVCQRSRSGDPSLDPRLREEGAERCRSLTTRLPPL